MSSSSRIWSPGWQSPHLQCNENQSTAKTTVSLKLLSRKRPEIGGWWERPQKAFHHSTRTPRVHLSWKESKTRIPDPAGNTYLYLFLWLCLWSWNLCFFPSAPGTFISHRSHHIQYIQNNVQNRKSAKKKKRQINEFLDRQLTNKIIF